MQSPWCGARQSEGAAREMEADPRSAAECALSDSSLALTRARGRARGHVCRAARAVTLQLRARRECGSEGDALMCPSANQGLSSRARGIAPPGKAELPGAEALGQKPWSRGLGAEALGQAVRGAEALGQKPWGKRCGAMLGWG